MNNDPFLYEIFQTDFKACVHNIYVALQAEANPKTLSHEMGKIAQASALIQLDELMLCAKKLQTFFENAQTAQTALFQEIATFFFKWTEVSSLDLPNILAQDILKIEKICSTAPASSQISTTPPLKTPSNSPLDVPADLIELFLTEIDEQSSQIGQSLLELETAPHNFSVILDKLMRHAHSLKGAAKAVKLPSIVGLAHIMEDIFIQLKGKDKQAITSYIDPLLHANDLFIALGKSTRSQFQEQLRNSQSAIEEQQKNLENLLQGKPPLITKSASTSANTNREEPHPVASPITPTTKERAIKISSEHLNSMIGLSGEMLVQSQRFPDLIASLIQFKQEQYKLQSLLSQAYEYIAHQENLHEAFHSQFEKGLQLSQTLQLTFSDKLNELELFGRKYRHIADNLYHTSISSRMRPFKEGVHGFPRMVRDVAKQLGKKARLEIRGENTEVDREILEKLEAPLNHLLRNAVDHGLEMPEERIAAGKKEEGLIVLEARHKSGMLHITIRDDGKGIQREKVRSKIIANKMATADMVDALTETELFQFLFLPGFSTASTVSEISGRGVGLDVVHSMVQEVAGTIQVSSDLGKSSCFSLQLPLTLSVISALIVDIAGQAYAIPLVKIDRLIKVFPHEIKVLEDQQFIEIEGKPIAMIAAHFLFNLTPSWQDDSRISVVILESQSHRYGIGVDQFLMQREIVVHPLDRRLGKVAELSAGALTDEGEPMFILDVDDVIRSIENYLDQGRFEKFPQGKDRDSALGLQSGKGRILVVDDSRTVREVEKRLLQSHGYYVDTANDGIEGLITARDKAYSLIISDIDMPRMNGFELLAKLQQDEKLRSIPVVIVSYKDREEDRFKALKLGAKAYLTKGSFHDDTLIKLIRELLPS